ncbi:MAG: hypothetical protein K1X89_02710 [Myxococcaceae bacterium]|nr:hypothetical protein [Myxococcaceae bacterium]
MLKRLVAAAAAVVLSGCVKEITSEERLERETQSKDPKSAATAEELSRIKCSDTNDTLQKARNDTRPETDRLQTYIELYESLNARRQKFEEAMSRNPDLAYKEGSQELVAAREECVQQSADVKVEFERYVRELVDVPTVQEIRGGSTVVVARLDFTVLRQAIETLNGDDRDALLNRVANAEKKVEVKPDAKKPKK